MCHWSHLSTGLKYAAFVQDISKAQRIVTATKSPMNVSVMSREVGGVKVCQMEKVSPDSSRWPLFDLGLARYQGASVCFPEQPESQMKESHSPSDTMSSVNWETTVNKFQSSAFCLMNILADIVSSKPPLLKICIAACAACAVTDSLHALLFTAISLCPCRLEVTASRIRWRNQSWEAKSYQNHSRCVLPQPVWKW